jgi:RNA polymerase subunit RPABC4/transcription elongation factor Spt4
MSIISCPRCGHARQDYEDRCPNCGLGKGGEILHWFIDWLPKPSDFKMPALAPCRTCGHQVDRKALRCPACGARLNYGCIAKFFALLMIVVGLVILLGVAFLLFTYSKT